MSDSNINIYYLDDTLGGYTVWDSPSQPQSDGTLPNLPPLSSQEKYRQGPSGLLIPSGPSDNEILNQPLGPYVPSTLMSWTFATGAANAPDPEPLPVVDRDTPVVGFRGWYYGTRPKLGEDPEPRLMAAHSYFGPWTPGINKAKCNGGKGQQPHTAPHELCDCGFYVLADLDELENHIAMSKSMVVGAVLGWGDVIQHGEEGWRAEYAQIIALMDIKRSKKALRRAEQAADAYGVPLLSRRGIMAMVAEYGDPLPKEES